MVRSRPLLAVLEQYMFVVGNLLGYQYRNKWELVCMCVCSWWLAHRAPASHLRRTLSN